MREFSEQIWWGYILKYQVLTDDFVKEITEESWSKRKWLMLPYQKNKYSQLLLDMMTSEDKEEHLNGSWLYKTKTFKKEQVLNCDLYECFENDFIAVILVDENRYVPNSFHYQFIKGKTLKIFATPTNEERSKGFEVRAFYDKTYKYSPI